MQPKKVKFIKKHKFKVSKKSNRGNLVCFGDYGLKSLDCGFLTSKQIESARKVISKKIRDIGKLWIRVFPDLPITKKPIEVRQGKGCGSIDHWVVPIESGRIIFEISGVSLQLVKSICRLVSFKLPIKIYVSNIVNF